MTAPLTDYATLPLPLTPVEKEQLADYEATITRGINTFYAVAGAFAGIKQLKLYRVEYRTFEEYCVEKWGITRQRAYQLMDAAEVRENLSTTVDILPENERQIRELKGLEPDQQRQVWQKAVDTAPGGKVTAQHIKDVRQAEIPMPKPEPQPVSAPVHQVSVFVPQEQPRPKYGPCARCGKTLTGPGHFKKDGAICDVCDRLDGEQQRAAPVHQASVFVPPPAYESKICDICKKRFPLGLVTMPDGRHLCMSCCQAVVDDEPDEREPEIEEQIIDVYDQIDNDLQAIDDEREPEAVITDDLEVEPPEHCCTYCHETGLLYTTGNGLTVCQACIVQQAQADNNRFHFMHQDRARMCAAGLVVLRVDLYSRKIFSYDPQKGGTWKLRLKCKNDGEMVDAVMRISEEPNTIFENRV